MPRPIKDVYEEIQSDREKEEWKVAGIELLQEVAQTALEKKINKFNQNKEVLNANINFKTAVNNSEKIISEHEAAYNNTGGVIDYYQKQFAPLVTTQIQNKYKEEKFEPDKMNSLIYNESLRLAQEQKELLDNAYRQAMALRGGNETDITKVMANYDQFVRINDARQETLGGAIGARIRRRFTGETRASLDAKAIEAIKNSTYADNTEAFNTALDAYNSGFTFTEAREIAALTEADKRKDREVTKRTREFLSIGPDNRKVPVMKIEGITADGKDFIDYTSEDSVIQDVLKGKIYKTVETTTTNIWNEKVKAKEIIRVNAAGMPIGSPVISSKSMDNTRVGKGLTTYLTSITGLSDNEHDSFLILYWVIMSWMLNFPFY